MAHDLDPRPRCRPLAAPRRRRPARRAVRSSMSLRYRRRLVLVSATSRHLDPALRRRPEVEPVSDGVRIVRGRAGRLRSFRGYLCEMAAGMEPDAHSDFIRRERPCAYTFVNSHGLGRRSRRTPVVPDPGGMRACPYSPFARHLEKTPDGDGFSLEPAEFEKAYNFTPAHPRERDLYARRPVVATSRFSSSCCPRIRRPGGKDPNGSSRVDEERSSR